MTTEIKNSVNYAKRTFLGKVENENIYLYAPEWACGWYWSFGNIGNNNCSYHIDGLMETTNLYDGFKNHFGSTFVIKESDIWVFSELFKTMYLLKETAEVFGRGGSHYCSNPAKEIIKNDVECERINNIVLPAIFAEIYKVIERNKDNEMNFNKLVSLNLEGNTNDVVDFMLLKGIKTDDLKAIKELSSHDFNVIHSYYWKRFHANKNK